MSGETKRKYDYESMLIAKSITQSLKKFLKYFRSTILNKI